MAAGRAARRLRRLRTVQRRTFDYDGRGFLRWESHPELGMASFTYDARAHVTAKDQSAAETQFDLRYEYDAAERLLTLSARNPLYGDLGQPQFRVMKEFAYGTDAPNLSGCSFIACCAA